MRSSRRTQLLLVLVTSSALAPFLNKAFHIDDPLFLWMAQQITNHPLDPYGLAVNWSISPEPMWQVMQNPPLCSYWIALVASVLGWSELALHLAFLIWPIMSILAVFAIARRFCREPVLAALLTLFTPAFLVSGTNVMCDLMLLALWLWSIECWIAGLDRQQWSLLAISAILASAAALTKYFGISVVPLLAVYTLVRDRRLAGRIILLAIPVVVIAAFEIWSRIHYGTGLFIDAAVVSRSVARLRPSWFAQFLIGLAFTGGCLVSAVFYPPRRHWRFWLAALSSAIGFIILFSGFVPLNDVFAIGQNRPSVQVEGGIFAAIGAGIIALAITAVLRDYEASTVLLALWIVGTFSFATFFNWSISGRAVLPAAPAVMILLMRWRDRMTLRPEPVLSRYLGLLPAAAVSLTIAWADYRQADTAREASHEFQQRFQANLGSTWFESHWGFHYYMQKWSAVPLNAIDSEVNDGDRLIFPANNTSIIPVSMEKLSPIETKQFSTLPFISTHGRGTGAAFYSSVRGVLPWTVDRVPPEIYYVTTFR